MNKKNNIYDTEEKYLIACDLDGTLLNSDGKLSKRTIETIKSVSKSNHLVCLITGRPYDGSISIYKELKLNTILVNQNGSFMSKPNDGQYVPIAMGFSKDIIKKILSNKTIKSIIRNVLIEGIGVCWLWSKPTDDEIEEEMKKIYHLEGRNIANLNGDYNLLSTDVSTMIFELPNIDDLNKIIYEIRTISPNLEIRNWSLPSTNSTIIEICSKFANKWTAIKYLQSYYGIPNERCLAFGDGDNDVQMLSRTIWSFAMKNASSASRLAARFMTKYTNDEDGVAREIENFFSNLNNKK